MTPFAVAVERKQWEIVTLRLLLAVSEAARRVPPETLSELVELLGEGLPREVRRER